MLHESPCYRTNLIKCIGKVHGHHRAINSADAQSSKFRSADAISGVSIDASRGTPSTSPPSPKLDIDQQSNGTRKRSIALTSSLNSLLAAAGNSANAALTQRVASERSCGQTF